MKNVFLAILLATLAWGCSSSKSSSSAAANSVSSFISPTTVTVAVGGSQTFVATITGSSSVSVTWFVDAIAGGNATVGTITAAGVYTAPATAGTHTITATSTSDSSQSASASVTVQALSGTTTILAYQTTYYMVPNAQRNVWVNLCNGTNSDGCTAPPNLNVNWVVSSGGCTVSPATGVQFATITAPASAGNCSITAIPVFSPANAANITVQVLPTTLRHSIAPFYEVLYQGQYTILQSLLYGDANTTVNSWSVSPNNGGLQLLGSGRAIGAKGVSAGTYTVTANSALGTTASATLIVSASVLPNAQLPSKVFPIDCTAYGSGTTYEVTNNATFDAVPWNTLGAGDTVRIHYNATAYTRQIQIKTSGTATQPIRICGVRDSATGSLPTISGVNATPENFTSNIPDWGGIVLFSNQYGYTASTGVNYIIIEGLQMTDFNSGVAHSPTYDAFFGVPVVMRGAHDVVLRGMDLANSSEGLTMSAQYPESKANRRVVLEGNWFHNNGVVNNYSYHSAYLQGDGCVVQGNYWGTNIAGSLGSTLKDRCANTYIRYNYLEGTARTIDLCEIQDWSILAVPYQWSLRDSADPLTLEYVASVHETYQHAYVYGNIVNDDASVSPTTPEFPFHYFPDVQPAVDHDPVYDTLLGGQLFFYYNTVRTKQSDAPVLMFDLSRGQSAMPNTWPSAYAVNNIFDLEANGGALPLFEYSVSTTDRVNAGVNWATTGWNANNSGFYYYTAAADYHPYQTAYSGAHTTGTTNTLAGTTVPFTLATYVLPASSAALGIADTSSTALSGISDLLPQFNYHPDTQTLTPRLTLTDVGAMGSQ